VWQALLVMINIIKKGEKGVLYNRPALFIELALDPI